MKNVERFNLYTAHIFGMLYEQFPVARRIDAAEVAKALNLAPRPADEKPSEANFVAETVQWLTATGYLYEIQTALASRYVLAPKAFEALNAKLSSLQGKDPKADEPTLGERLASGAVDAGTGLAKEAWKQVATEIVGQVIGYAMKAFTGAPES